MSYRYSSPSADPAANTPGLVGLNCIPVMEENAPLEPEIEEKKISQNQIINMFQWSAATFCEHGNAELVMTRKGQRKLECLTSCTTNFRQA